jgi:hypothetical protein
MLTKVYIYIYIYIDLWRVILPLLFLHTSLQLHQAVNEHRRSHTIIADLSQG